MGVFKVPRATTAQRITIILDPAEIVFDTDLNTYYGGDGETLGGFPIGNGVSTDITQIITLTQNDINNKYAFLSNEAFGVETTIMHIDGSGPQVYGIDYTIDKNKVIWSGSALDGVLEVNDKMIITYESNKSIGSIETRERIIISVQNIAQKQINLANTPNNPSLVKLIPDGGIQQIYGVDYSVTGQILTWNGLGLENLIESGDTLTVTY